MNREGVLLITEDPRHGECRGLPGIGPWEWFDASTPQQAEQLIAGRQLRLGIVEYGSAANRGACMSWHQDVIRANRHLHWVAVICPSLLGDPHFADHLSTYFFAYQTAPVELARMAAVLESAEAMAKLRLAQRDRAGAPSLIGDSPAMQQLRQQIARSADAGGPILVSGEVGSGKNATAKAIHESSHRRHAPFRLVRSISLPGCLMAACAPARGRRISELESDTEAAVLNAAHNGTLVLDEIGDLSPLAQRILLRCLDSPPGSMHLIATTHMDLIKAVAEDRFRGDLFHRLNELHLDIPPLRERDNDLVLLADHFLQSHWTVNRHITGFSRAALDAMYRHHWPGNVRELKSRIRRAMLLTDDYLVHPEDLGFAPALDRTAATGFRGAVAGGHEGAPVGCGPQGPKPLTKTVTRDTIET